MHAISAVRRFVLGSQLFLGDEVRQCPACGSSRLRVLHLIRSAHQRLVDHPVLFVSGCRTCGLAFANPLPKQDRIDAYYAGDDGWKQIKGIDSKNFPVKQLNKKRRVSALVLDRIQPHLPPGAIGNGNAALDFGCGYGGFLDVLQDRGWETFGIETGVKVAAMRHAMLDDIPADERFSLIIANHVMEHLPQPMEVLERLVGALRVGGHLFISVPSLDALPDHGKLTYCVSFHHLMSYTHRALACLLAGLNCEVVTEIDDAKLRDATCRGRLLRMRVLFCKHHGPVRKPKRPLKSASDSFRAFRMKHPRGATAWPIFQPRTIRQEAFAALAHWKSKAAAQRA